MRFPSFFFVEITRGVIHYRRLYHHHPRGIEFSTYTCTGQVYSIQLREVGSVREHLPLQTWSRCICVKAPKVPEGEPEPLSESVYVPVPVPVPVPEPVPVCVAEPVNMDEPHPDPKGEGKAGEGFWDVYTVLQNLATILAIFAAVFSTSGYLKKLSGGERKKFEDASKNIDQLLLVMLLQLEISEQILKKMDADEKAKKESWFFKFIGYR